MGICTEGHEDHEEVPCSVACFLTLVSFYCNSFAPDTPSTPDRCLQSLQQTPALLITRSDDGYFL